MTPLVKETLQRLEAGKTTPGQYSAFMAFIQQATPSDVALISRSSLPDDFKLNIDKLSGMMTRAYSVPRSFTATLLHPAISLFSGSGRGRKNLVIGFCGKAQLLLLPAPLVLQFFSEQEFDVVILRDTLMSGFATGIPGFGASIDEVLARLDRTLDFAAYKSVRIVGTSGGGAAGLVAGRMVDAAVACSVGGHLPSSSPRYGKTAAAAALELALVSPVQSDCRLYCVFGADHAVDKREAETMASACRAILVPIAGCDDHNVLHYAFLEGRLPGLLNEIGLTRIDRAPS